MYSIYPSLLHTSVSPATESGQCLYLPPGLGEGGSVWEMLAVFALLSLQAVGIHYTPLKKPELV